MWKLFVLAGPMSGVLAVMVLSAAGSDTGSPSTTIPVALISSAVTGLGIIMSGKIVVPTFAYNREKERADKWEAEVLRLNQVMADRHVPSLDAATHAVTDSNATLTRALEILARRRT
jgi:hypothetical protein